MGASRSLIIVGSLAGFVCGQTLNAWVVVAIKARTKERHLWARLIGSTIVGEFADTLVFCSFAAWAIGINTVRDFLIYVISGWFYKIGRRGRRPADHLPGDRTHQTPRADLSACGVGRYVHPR